MLIAPLNILIFCFGIYSALSKKINFYLLSLIYFSTSFFGFISHYTDYGLRAINNSDLAILLLLTGICFLPKKNNLLGKLKLYRTLKKITNIFIVFLSGLIFYDIFIMGNSFLNVLNESRIYLFLLSLQLIDRIDLNQTSKLINLIVVLISIKSVIYVSQYIFNIEIFETTEFLLSIDKFSGFYILSPLIIIYLLNKTKITFIDFLCIFFLILSSLLYGSSGIILANAGILFCFIYLKKSLLTLSFRFFITPMIILFVAFFPSQFFQGDGIFDEFSTDYSEATSFLDEFNSSDDISEFYNGGSFQFRLAMFAERVFYLIDSNKLLFGDGFTPDSKLDSQIFIIGTQTDVYSFGIEQYNSADFLYVNTISRFGLIGTILFIFLFIYLYKFKKYNMFFFLSLIIFILLTSLNSSLLYKMNNFILLFLIVFSEVQSRLNYYYPKKL